MPYRLITLIIKEMRTILRDRQSRVIIIVPVLLQVILFPFAATLEITNASIGIYAEDQGRHAVELSQRIARAASFSRCVPIYDEEQLHRALDNQDILLAVRFSPGFSRMLDTGGGAGVQLVLDGRRSNGAQIALNYVQAILAGYQAERAAQALHAGEPPGTGQAAAAAPGIQLEFRNWYNPNLEYAYFVLPSLVALITTIIVLILTALSVAREREQGTLEQLLVSPLSTWQIFVGKAVPAIIISMFQGSIILVAGIFAYGIPFAGSLALFYAMMLLYALSLIGVGLLISAVCSTQQQAFIGVFLFMMPAILLSGYISPVENMPQWLQYGSMINPIRHFTEICKQIYLKGSGLAVIWGSVWPMLLISACSLSVAYALFRRKVA